MSDVCPDCGMPAHDDDWSECVRLLRGEVARLRREAVQAANEAALLREKLDGAKSRLEVYEHLEKVGIASAFAAARAEVARVHEEFKRDYDQEVCVCGHVYAEHNRGAGDGCDHGECDGKCLEFALITSDVVLKLRAVVNALRKCSECGAVATRTTYEGYAYHRVGATCDAHRWTSGVPNDDQDDIDLPYAAALRALEGR